MNPIDYRINPTDTIENIENKIDTITKTIIKGVDSETLDGYLDVFKSQALQFDNLINLKLSTLIYAIAYKVLSTEFKSFNSFAKKQGIDNTGLKLDIIRYFRMLN